MTFVHFHNEPKLMQTFFVQLFCQKHLPIQNQIKTITPNENRIRKYEIVQRKMNR